MSQPPGTATSCRTAPVIQSWVIKPVSTSRTRRPDWHEVCFTRRPDRARDDLQQAVGNLETAYEDAAAALENAKAKDEVNSTQETKSEKPETRAEPQPDENGDKS